MTKLIGGNISDTPVKNIRDGSAFSAGGGAAGIDLGTDANWDDVELMFNVRDITDIADLVDMGPKAYGAPTIVASAGYPKIITVDQSKWHTGVALDIKSASGTGLKWPDSSGITQPADSNWTVECLMLPRSTGTHWWTGNGSGSGANPGPRWEANFNPGGYQYGYAGSQTLSHTPAVDEHIHRSGLMHTAWTRSGTTSYMHNNGYLTSSVTITGTWASGNEDGINVMNAGLTGDSTVRSPTAHLLFAYRLTIGTARYTGTSFDVPWMGFPESGA